jgi:membrane-associated phospholipid phosphatase
MTFLTDFADQAVMLPVVAAVALVLAAFGWWRGALVWLAVIGVTFGVILLFKVGLLGCQPIFGPWSLRSPSGHVAAASVVAGGLAALLTRRRWIVLAVAVLAAALIGMSRLELGFHSIPEVLFGAATGITGAAVLSRQLGARPSRRPMPLLAVVAVLALLLHGIHLPAEATIGQASHGVLHFVPGCRGATNQVLP